MADELRHVRRHYAHFHRALGDLLTRSVAEESIWWLSDRQEHTLNPDGEDNLYAKAVYTLPKIEPYQNRLDELRAVQVKTIALFGKSSSKPNAAITLPLILVSVQSIQINRVNKRNTEPLSKAKALSRMDRLTTTSTATWKPSDAIRRLLTPGSRPSPYRLGRLLTPKPLFNPQGTTPFISGPPSSSTGLHYLLNGTVENVYITDHGLLAVGSDVSLSFNTHTRKPRADQVAALPFYQDDHVRIYEEGVWQNAKGRYALSSPLFPGSGHHRATETCY